MNVENFRGLLAKYKFQGIIVDTNLMVLLLVGIVNRDRITKFKRTSQFRLAVGGAFPQGNRGYLLITIDSPLVSMMESRSLDVINFNHLRYGQM